MISVAVATEDLPSEQVAERLIRYIGGNVDLRLRREGFGYLKSKFPSFCEIARQMPVLVLTDLDRAPCPHALVQAWIGQIHMPPDLVFRVVVREIEAWLLADREGFSQFLGISPRLLPHDPETLNDPKAEVLRLARRARAAVRRDLLPSNRSTAPQGLGYSSRLSEFAQSMWDIERACESSDSLRRALTRLQEMALRTHDATIRNR